MDGGAYRFIYMPETEILTKHKAKSPSKNSSYSPWKTDYESMCKKTAIKALAKFAPKSVEFQNVLMKDETVKDIENDDNISVYDLTDMNVIEGD
jgi:recombination protein RecT